MTKTTEEYKLFFEKDIQPLLNTKIQSRGKNFNVVLYSFILLAGGSVFFFCYGFYGMLIFLPIFLFIVWIYEEVNQRKNRFDHWKRIKHTVIPKILRFINPAIQYEATKFLNRYFYFQSRLFFHRCDFYKGEDYFCGVLGKTKIECSEIFAKEIRVINNSDGTVTKTAIIFSGVLFVADFYKDFKGVTCIFPDQGFVEYMSLLSGLEPVRLENPDFEKMFSVYSQDQIEARYILSMSLMERIKNLAKKIGRPIKISFVDSRMFIALDWADFLDKNTKSIEDGIHDVFLSFQSLIDIVEDLNLNTRIWSKQ